MRSRFGFTVAEVVIATVVLSLFIAGAFAYYRMGNRTFLAGSWRLNKSKQLERFLATLKEHIEACSSAAQIGVSVTLSRAIFNVLENNRAVTASHSISKQLYLMAFPVCKPDLTQASYTAAIDSKAAKGLVLYDLLCAEKKDKKSTEANASAQKDAGLFRVVLYSSTTPAKPSIQYFEGQGPGFDGKNNPRLFGLNVAESHERVYELTDVASLSIFSPPPTPKTTNSQPGSGAGNAANDETDEDELNSRIGQTVGIAIECRHPTIRNTFVKHQIQALLDIDVDVQNFKN